MYILYYIYIYIYIFKEPPTRSNPGKSAKPGIAHHAGHIVQHANHTSPTRLIVPTKPGPTRPATANWPTRPNPGHTETWPNPTRWKPAH